MGICPESSTLSTFQPLTVPIPTVSSQSTWIPNIGLTSNSDTWTFTTTRVQHTLKSSTTSGRFHGGVWEKSVPNLIFPSLFPPPTLWVSSSCPVQLWEITWDSKESLVPVLVCKSDLNKKSRKNRATTVQDRTPTLHLFWFFLGTFFDYRSNALV